MADITQWEYKAIPGDAQEEDLNKLGAEGWELAASKESNGNTYKMVMKRPKQPQRPAPSDGYGYGR